MSKLNGVSIHVRGIGRGKFCVSANCDGRAFVDTASLWEAGARRELAQAIAATFGIQDAEPIEHELTRLALETARQEDESRRSKEDDGKTFKVEDVEPWPSPVELRDVLEEAREAVLNHMFMPEDMATAAAIWAAYTHVFDHFDVCPILAITSPTKRCGKSTLLQIMGRLVSRPLTFSNITPAALFRIISDFHPTLLIDEGDTFFEGNSELRGLINSGFLRDAAFVPRVNPETLQTERFTTWCPKTLAAIGNLHPTIEDRAIVLRLERKPRDLTKARLTRTSRERLGLIGRKFARWAKDSADEIDPDCEPDTPECLNDRAADCWRPLLALADLAGGKWPQRVRKAILSLANDEADESETPIRLLRNIGEILSSLDDDVIETRTLLERLHDYDEWAHYGYADKPLNAHQLARLLRPFGVRPVKTRTIRGYDAADLRAVITKYCPPPPGESATSATHDVNHDRKATYSDPQSATQSGGGASGIQKAPHVSDGNNATYDECGAYGASIGEGAAFSQNDNKQHPQGNLFDLIPTSGNGQDGGTELDPGYEIIR